MDGQEGSLASRDQLGVQLRRTQGLAGGPRDLQQRGNHMRFHLNNGQDFSENAIWMFLNKNHLQKNF